MVNPRKMPSALHQTEHSRCSLLAPNNLVPFEPCTAASALAPSTDTKTPPYISDPLQVHCRPMPRCCNNISIHFYHQLLRHHNSSCYAWLQYVDSLFDLMTDICLHINVAPFFRVPMDLAPIMDKAAPITVAAALRILTLLPAFYFA